MKAVWSLLSTGNSCCHFFLHHYLKHVQQSSLNASRSNYSKPGLKVQSAQTEEPRTARSRRIWDKKQTGSSWSSGLCLTVNNKDRLQCFALQFALRCFHLCAVCVVYLENVGKQFGGFSLSQLWMKTHFKKFKWGKAFLTIAPCFRS